MSSNAQKVDFATAINGLEEINVWFQTEDLNLDEGLAKLREGKDLIKQCREKLQAVENEFIKIKQEYNAEDVQAESLADGQATDHHVREVGIADTGGNAVEDVPF